MRLTSSHHEWIFGAGLALLLSLLAAVAAVPVGGPVDEVPVRVEVDPGAGERVAGQGGVLIVPGGAAPAVTARLRFVLPVKSPGNASRWVVWMPREPLDMLVLRGPGWAPAARDFFHPRDGGEDLPMGYVMPLPAGLSGEVVLSLQAKAALLSPLQPRVMRESALANVQQRPLALAVMVYASLFTLSLLGLALYSASHDRTFLAFFGYAGSALLLVATLNGHLYMAPGLDGFALWRGFGIWALCMVFSAALLQVLMRYAGTAEAHPDWARWIGRFCLGLLGIAAACLLNLDALTGPVEAIGALAWIATVVIGLVLLVDACRRGVGMAWTNLLLMLVTATALVAVYGAGRGWFPVGVLTRYGHEMALAANATLLAVGLIGRIGDYRDQRDRDRLARADTERRMQREAARNGFSTALETRLRTLQGEDVPGMAVRMLLEHLLPHLPCGFAGVATDAWHGRGVRLVGPTSSPESLAALLEKRGLLLRRQVGNGTPMQQLVALEGVSATELAVHLPIRAPGWGLLVLHRAGDDGFSTEEVSLAAEFARMAVTHADQQVAALQLRRTAEVDALTGTFNRRTIDHLLARSFAEAHRDRSPVSVLFVDLDHFKSINDTHGHACGDECLRHVARALRRALDTDDVLGRYGGEEFVAVLPARGGAAARVIGERLRSAVEACTIEWQGQPLRLTVSVGLATRHQDESAPEATLARADKALYAAKRSGRNRVQVAPAVFS